MPTNTIQSLWIGPTLSAMERLSIRSFLTHGYSFHLYAYEAVTGVPEGAEVRCGTEILPREKIFCYRRGHGKGSPSAFSNMFRYKLLLEKGGWWTDLDSVCLRRLDFADAHVAGYEREPNGTTHLAVGLLKAPAGSPLMERCWTRCRTMNQNRIRWGQMGPRLYATAVRDTGMNVCALAPDAFYPIDYWSVDQLVAPRDLPGQSHSIHLWNSQWKKAGLDPDANYEPNSIYERLKRRFGVQAHRETRSRDEAGSEIRSPRRQPSWRRWWQWVA